MARSAAGELRATFSASSWAAWCSRSGGSTTSLTMPSSYARAALIRSCLPTSAIRSTASAGIFRIKAMVSTALTWPIET